MALTDEDKQWVRELLAEHSEHLVKLIIDVKESLEKEIGSVREEVASVREELVLVGKRLDRVEATMLHVDGRMTALAQADIVTDRQLTDVLARQFAQQHAIDDLYARLKKLEQSSHPPQ
jgi:septal ring factor EnvC (AmiA/AmiB activator)